jgi:hypothetical protein
MFHGKLLPRNPGYAGCGDEHTSGLFSLIVVWMA